MLVPAPENVYPRAQCVTICHTEKVDSNGLCLCNSDSDCRHNEGKCYARNKDIGLNWHHMTRLPGVCAFGKFTKTDYRWPNPDLQPPNSPNVERRGTGYRMFFEQGLRPLQWDVSNELKYHSGCCAFTAVLTAREGSVLQLQFDSLAASYQKPAEIWVCMFASSSTEAYMRIIEIFKAKHPTIHVHAIVSSYNFKYFGRFQLAMQASTKYVALFDDDQIPGPTTLELLVNVAEKLKQPAILGLTGRVFSQPSATHGGQWYHMSDSRENPMKPWLPGCDPGNGRSVPKKYCPLPLDWYENSCKRTTGPRAPCKGGVTWQDSHTHHTNVCPVRSTPDV